MLVIENMEHFKNVVRFAKKTNQLDSLKSKLLYLHTYAEHGDKGKTRCVLYKDFAPQSFAFTMTIRKDDGYEHWFHGGFIYHGTHDNGGDGGAPTFSVNLTPEFGWSIHT